MYWRSLLSPNETGATGEHPLSPSVHMKLQLNGSGIPHLLHSTTTDATCTSDSTNSYLNCMANMSNDLEVLFYALINNPALIYSASGGDNVYDAKLLMPPIVAGKSRHMQKKFQASVLWCRKVLQKIMNHPPSVLRRLKNLS